MVAVTLIGKSNGVGLARDLQLLATILRQCGCSVQVHAADRADARRRRSLLVQMLARVGAWFRRRKTRAWPPSHVNVMLEHVWPQFLHTAPLNIAVPNPEWFDRRDRRLLSSVDGVWTKTHHAERVFSALGCRTAFIGFDSDDRYDPSVVREGTFFHLAGKSRMKGTDRLIEVWRRHPEWPRLIVVYHESGHWPSAPNIEWHREYLADEQLRRLQNASRFHLCLSEAEGWGHYIVEALSVGAVTLTLDAPPMNELVRPERGLLIDHVTHGRQNLSDTYRFESVALEAAVSRALQLDEPEVMRLGQAARSWFVDNRRGFPARIEQALGRLDSFAQP